MSLQGSPKGPYETLTLCSQTRGDLQGPPKGSFKRPPMSRQRSSKGPLWSTPGTLQNVHLVQPNERGTSTHFARQDCNTYGPPNLSLQGSPKGPYETPTLCSQRSGDLKDHPKGAPRHPPRTPKRSSKSPLGSSPGTSQNAHPVQPNEP
jgi:hypothetical protein